jgi:pyrimidine-nucleoside phosphorylase
MMAYRPDEEEPVMRAVDIILNKRAGKELSREELQFLIGGYTAGEIPDYQVSAWAMAVFFQGMSPRETAALTELMLNSGTVMDLSGIPGPLVDKHSTGGVGDKTSLIIAPLAASLGIRDPMMSGRALGHTGGTLDKLEAIPGYRTSLSPQEFKTILARDGFAMTGQTKDVVPADRLLYALRDVTGTVESIPLITASILAKKIAEGAEALVLDVKYGAGAFMKTPQGAEKLARSLVDTGSALGKKIIALLTDMDEPLGNMVGNFLEVEECYDCLDGKAPPGAAGLLDLSLELTARMLVLGGKAQDAGTAKTLCQEALARGKPRELFLANIKSQGGNPEEFLSLKGSYRSPCQGEIKAPEEGYISRIDAWKIGRGGVDLGVGRNRTEDPVSPTAGIQFLKKSGEPVSRGEPVMIVWGKDDAGLEAALPGLAGAVEYSPAPPAKKNLILKEIR